MGGKSYSFLLALSLCLTAQTSPLPSLCLFQFLAFPQPVLPSLGPDFFFYYFSLWKKTFASFLMRSTSKREPAPDLPQIRAMSSKLGTELNLSCSLQLSLCSCSGTGGEDWTAMTEKLHPFCLSSCPSHAPTDLQSQRWVSGLTHGQLVMGQQEKRPKLARGKHHLLFGRWYCPARCSRQGEQPGPLPAEHPREIPSPELPQLRHLMRSPRLCMLY